MSLARLRVASAGTRTAAQFERLARVDRRMRLANRIDLALILMTGVTMAIDRHL